MMRPHSFNYVTHYEEIYHSKIPHSAPPEMGVRWAEQGRHTSQMDRLRKRSEELAVAAPARPSGRDGVMASPPQPRRQWLLEGAGAAFQQSFSMC